MWGETPNSMNRVEGIQKVHRAQGGGTIYTSMSGAKACGMIKTVNR
jgi:hypothetical protein